MDCLLLLIGGELQACEFCGGMDDWIDRLINLWMDGLIRLYDYMTK
jgi:hypothetical protein